MHDAQQVEHEGRQQGERFVEQGRRQPLQVMVGQAVAIVEQLDLAGIQAQPETLTQEPGHTQGVLAEGAQQPEHVGGGCHVLVVVPQQVRVETTDAGSWVRARLAEWLTAHDQEHAEGDTSSQKQEDRVVKQEAHVCPSRRRAGVSAPMRRIHQ